MPSMHALAGLLGMSFYFSLQFLTATLAAILICLEHSFWHAHNGSSAADGFTMAWASYVGAPQAKVAGELIEHFGTKRATNQVVGWYALSEAEHAAFMKVIFENRLCMSHLHLPWKYVPHGDH